MPLSHRAQLECRYDGPIPPAEMAAAVAADRAAGVVVRIAGVRRKPEAARAQMAAACRRLILERQEVDRADLLRAGFSAEEIDRHGQAALAAATAGLEPQGRSIDRAGRAA